MTLVAGVDSSTQSCKVVVRDLETGDVVRVGRASHPDGTEVHPDHWWVALLAAIDDAGGLGDIAAISIGGQQHGMVALDADGNVVREALLWNDTRSAQAARDLIQEFGAEELVRRTGLVPVASFTSTKLRWLRDAEPENAARVAAVALPHDWLTWRLMGYGPAGASPLGPKLDALTTDRSDASGTGYWSPATGEYDRDLLVAALGHDAVVPTVIAPDGRAGTVGYDGPTEIVVGPGAGDNAGSGLGLGAGEGDVVVSLGTSGTVFAVTPEPVTDATGTIAGFADASGQYLPIVVTLNAARVLDSATRLLDVDFDGLAELALSARPGAGGVVLVPYFEGERTPNRPDATASLMGLTLSSSTRANIARAHVEGMLCGLADGVDAVRAHGLDAKRVLLVGGAAFNPAVGKVAAQVFGLPIDIPKPGEYVAMGATVQAAWSLVGSRPDWPVEMDTHIDPDPQPHVRAQYADATGQLYS